MAKTNHWRALAAAAGMLVAGGLLLLIMLVVEARPAEATFPGKPGKIAYSAPTEPIARSTPSNRAVGVSSISQTTLRATTILPTHPAAKR